MIRALQRWFTSSRPRPVEDELDRPLLFFGNEPLTLRACCEGVFVTGSSGSGKTSGSLAAIAKAYLRNGFGGIVTCCKPDEPGIWLKYARETGREHDLIFFGPRHRHRFNYLNYAASLTPTDTRPTENLTQLLGTVIDVANRSQSSNSQDPYWSRAAQQLIRNATDVILLANGTRGLSIQTIYETIVSAPTDPEQLRSREWQRNSRCMQMLDAAQQKTRGGTAGHDLQLTAKFFLNEFPNLSPRTRGCIISMVTTGIDPLLRGSVHELTNTTTNITPTATHQGKIVILDLPAKTYHFAGVLVQLIWKELWQQATEGRRIQDHSLPTFCICDEAQTFVSRNDSTFLMTARSSRACVVYLTQNLPNFRSALGRSETAALIGNLVTRIHHQNVCTETNSWASESISKCWKLRSSSGTSRSDDSDGRERMSQNATLSDSREYRVAPEAFLQLRRGGPQNDHCVDAIVSRPWPSGKTYLRVTFRQK